MALESFLVHYRNVRDFLFPLESTKNPDPTKQVAYERALDSVIAADFNPTGWTCESKDWKGVVPNERNRINQQLAHISYSRSQHDPNWPMAEMKSALMEQFERFLKSLPDERKAYFSQSRL